MLLVERTFCRSLRRCPFAVAMLLGKCFLTRVEVSPGHVVKKSAVIAVVSCSSHRWNNLPGGHQRNPLLGIKVRYMYWGQKDFSEKIETYQYMQKKEVSVLMGFLGL